MAKKSAVRKETLTDRISKVVDAVNKQCPSEHGDSSVGTLGNKKIKEIPKFSSGSLALDIALGGGYPWGRIIEIFGPESGGKTTLMLHAIANVQKENPDKMIAFIDAENSLDVYYAKKLGVDVSTLLISQPDSGEQAMNIVKTLIENGVKLIVVDSVAALTPIAQLREPIGKASMGLHAKLMSEGIRILNSLLYTSTATILFTNQLRSSMQSMGNPWNTTGGRALKFYASQRVEVKRIGSDTYGDERVNNIVVAKVVKNKVAPPFLKAQFKITFGKGIDMIEQMIDYGVELNLIEKAGAWFKIPSIDSSFQGHRKLYEFFDDKNNKSIRNTLESEILRRLDNVDGLENSLAIQDVKERDDKHLFPITSEVDIVNTITPKTPDNTEVKVEEI